MGDIMKQLVMFALLLLSASSFAAEKLMANIKSDVDGISYQFFIGTNENNEIDFLRVKWFDEKGKVIRDDHHMAERVIDEGVVLIEQKGREAVRLEVEKFSVKTGGIVIMNYLFNGVTGSRKFYRLKLKDLKLFEEANSKEVNSFFVFGNKVPVFGLVGIKDITGTFAK